MYEDFMEAMETFESELKVSTETKQSELFNLNKTQLLLLMEKYAPIFYEHASHHLTDFEWVDCTKALNADGNDIILTVKVGHNYVCPYFFSNKYTLNGKSVIRVFTNYQESFCEVQSILDNFDLGLYRLLTNKDLDLRYREIGYSDCRESI